jgi:hypothetical protein
VTDELMRRIYAQGPDKEYPVQLFFKDGVFAAQYEPAMASVIMAEGKTSVEALQALEQKMTARFDPPSSIVVDACGADGYAYLPGGIKVMDHCRQLYQHSVACWVSDRHLADVDQVEVGPEDFYLVHKPGGKQVAVVFPADHNHDQWRMQEFDPDTEVIEFMKLHGAWRTDPQPALAGSQG